MRIQRIALAGALSLAAATSAGAVTWVGANASTSGFGVHAGLSLLRIPVIGAVGVEGTAERGWGNGASNRYAVGATLRDLNLPITRVDAFATIGAEYSNSFALYGEGGLRGPLIGSAGWRAFVRGSSAGRFGAGVGLELRF
ncbi:hypothetical protein [Deinococcus koreensis]|uniref:hypothetical protein n=1 Tax=Deinococcus koreensis TaxID=2054903 RepID=UPI0013FD83E6|nr:hypothetical protein [Deinococcus koreensis]